MKTRLRSLAFCAFTLLAAGSLKAQPANDLFANGWVLNGLTVSTNGNSSTATREDGEPWDVFAARVGSGQLEGIVKDLSMPVDFGLETMNEFIDWNRNAPFKVERGEGECAV